MAMIDVSPRYSDILMLYGKDVYSSDFRFILDGIAKSPVTLRSHDIWVIHRAGGGFSADSTPCGSAGARLKWCANINGFDFNNASVSAAQAYLQTFLHEIGHFWLVPSFRMRLGRTGANLVAAGTLREFINAFFRSEDIPSFCLLAKQDSHWTYYMSAGPTTFESPDWVEIPASRTPLEGTSQEGQEFENILREYQPNPTSRSVPVRVGKLGDAQVGRPFHDLDLTLMGVLQPAEAYVADNNVFYELVPQWIAPVSFMSGICVVFAPDDIVQFGFYTGHQRIGIQRTGQPPETVDIGRFYTPAEMWNFDSHLAFRVVRRGNDYHFQVRKEITRAGCLAEILASLNLFTRPAVVDMFSDSNSIPPANLQGITGLDRWVTMRSFADQRTPVACGYMVKTWGDAPPLVDTHFTGFQLKSTTDERILSTSSIDVANPNYVNLLDDATLLFHYPQMGPYLHQGRNFANLVVGATVPDGAGGTREVGNHDHWTGVDRAPKLLVRCPPGDFIAGGKVKLFRTAMAPHGGGTTPDMRLWGFRRERHLVRDGADNIALDAARMALQTDHSPYRCAFILLARTRDEITDAMLDTLDTYRLATPEAFRLATNGRRSISVTLR